MKTPNIETIEYRPVGDFDTDSMRRAGVAKNTIAINVYRLRSEYGMSQRQLAETIGTKQPNISNLERGDANPTIEFLGRVAEALNVDVNELTSHEDGGQEHREPTEGPRRSQERHVSGTTWKEPLLLRDLVSRRLPKSTRTSVEALNGINRGLELSA